MNLFGLENNIINILKSNIGQTLPNNAERITRTEFEVLIENNNNVSSYYRYIVRNNLIQESAIIFVSNSRSSLFDSQTLLLNILDGLGEPYTENNDYIEWFHDGYSIVFNYIFTEEQMFYIWLNVNKIKFGISTSNISEIEARNLNIAFGILVNDIMPSTPADRSELIIGDIIIAINNIQLRSELDFNRIFDEASVNDIINFLVIRNNERINIQLKL